LPDPEPRELWCPLISADDHVLEPADLFVERMPAKMRDVAPRIEYFDYAGDEVPYWVIDGERLPMFVADGTVGRPTREWGRAPQRFEEFRAGVCDADARVRDMDLNGTWASLLFPSTTFGFAGSRLTKIRDREVGFAAVRAYNDWMMEEWVGSHPLRFISHQIPWFDDVERSISELQRNAARGCRAVSFAENPAGLGFASIYTGHWDPFLAACQDTDTVINLHVGSSGFTHTPAADAPADTLRVLFPIHAVDALVNWIYAKIPLRFPRLKIVLSEGGVSWVPMALERIERAYRVREGRNWWGEADGNPLDLVRRNFWFSSVEDPSAFHALDIIGEDRVFLEVDYPHADCTWPDTQALVRSELEHLSPDVVRKIAFETAADLYRHPRPPEAMIRASVVGKLSTSANRSAK
jgi:predicted TIM-barrel fold metal-dependent hydrolase